MGRFARLLGVAAGGLALANCSGGTGKLDPRYGVSASPRVVSLGERAPKGGGKYRVGQPYVVAGRTYYPEENINYSAVGLASWYGDDFHGRYTANGEVFDENSISAAHPTLPLPSYVRVTNLANHKSIVVRVNDRGPYVQNRIIDLSVRTAKLLGFYGNGIAKVKVEYIGRAPLTGSDDRKLEATLRDNVRESDRPVLASAEKNLMVASAGSRPYVPTYFDNRPMTNIPAPPDRPYALGDDQASAPPAAPTTELAAATRPRPVERAAPEPEPSPVSAYAPTRYDGHTGGVLNGRGLY